MLTKSMGSSNPHNVVKATMDALTRLVDARAVAKRRGMDLKGLFGTTAAATTP